MAYDHGLPSGKYGLFCGIWHSGLLLNATWLSRKFCFGLGSIFFEVSVLGVGLKDQVLVQSLRVADFPVGVYCIRLYSCRHCGPIFPIWRWYPLPQSDLGNHDYDSIWKFPKNRIP